MPEDAPDPSDIHRQLALRRADLEREFDGKLRDLKDQHKRRMDAFEREKAEFESMRRTKTKELADREERLKQNERKSMEATLKVQTVRSEVEARKDRLEHADDVERKAAQTSAKAQARVDATAEVLESTRRRLLGLGIGLLVAALLQFLAAVVVDESWLLVPAPVFAAAGLAALSLRGQARAPEAPSGPPDAR